MNKYPEWIQVGNKKYKINTSFRIALRCDEIFRDDSICDYEKTLAIIYLLLGEEAMKDSENQEAIIRLLTKYLLCGKNTEEIEGKDEEPSMDFSKMREELKSVSCQIIALI